MDDVSADTLLPEPRRLDTHSRETLLSRFHARERQARTVIAVELLVIVGGGLWWLISHPSDIPGWQAALIFAVGFLGLFEFALAPLYSNRKRLDDLQPETRFGPHTRDSLLAAVQRVQDRLGLSQHNVRVYLAREKDVNAFAHRLELLPGWRLFNGVQLNRSILHLLDEDELESIIGHELGHLYPYAPLGGRCMLLHGLLSGVLSLVIARLLSDYEFRVGAPLVALAIVRWLPLYGSAAQVRLIEFLCDDYGACAAGVTPALTAEIKLGLEQEARSHLMLRVLEARQANADLPLEDLMKDYEAALPWGGVESELARKQLEQSLRRRIEQTETTSLRGFYNHIFNDEVDDSALKESIARMRVVRQIAKVPIALADVLIQPHRLAECMRLIEEHPDRVLLHLEDEVNDQGSTHPSPSRRILYLWRNRVAIATESK